MNQILNKIFKNKEFWNNFKKYQDASVDFYYKNNQEYYIVSEYSFDEINNFFVCDKTNNLVAFFDKIKNTDIFYNWADKNTSLIIYVKSSDLKNDFLKFKNQIMKIEEDEYFFRKYIIVYDNLWEKELNNITSNEILNMELNNINLNKFREEGGFINSTQYLLIQLFIKLPFLNVIVASEKLENLIDVINKEINNKQLTLLNTKILEHNLLTQVNKLENNNLQNHLKALKNSFFSDDAKMADNFLDLFHN